MASFCIGSSTWKKFVVVIRITRIFFYSYMYFFISNTQLFCAVTFFDQYNVTFSDVVKCNI
ncbi:hypothetical protein HanIR_Chr14g0698121 [Helianthus annuus]|nr:hypothetical protein HanIR_Chr14g0698121 [Helianthus annuus]